MESRRRADLRIGDEPAELRGILDGVAVQGGDDVAGTESCIEGRGVAIHLRDHRAVSGGADRLLVDRHVFYAEVDGPATHFAVFQEVVDDMAYKLARDGEADALVSAALREDARIDPDELAARVNQ